MSAEGYKKWKSNVKGKLCLCSRPAVAYSLSGFVCAHCQAIESKLEQWHLNAHKSQQNKLIDRDGELCNTY